MVTNTAFKNIILVENREEKKDVYNYENSFIQYRKYVFLVKPHTSIGKFLTAVITKEKSG